MYYVNWFDAVAYCNALSTLRGYECVYKINKTTVTGDFSKNGYRLPTEAEWQFAACGGTKSRGYKYSGSKKAGDVSWTLGNSTSTSHPVGEKMANELGLYDMSGNVWEWCHDWFGKIPSKELTDYTGNATGSYRVKRGGSWLSVADYAQVKERFQEDPLLTDNNIGFRVVRGVLY